MTPQEQNQESIENKEKESKHEAARREILNRVVSGRIKDQKDKVAFILNNFPETRNSDIKLQWKYWEIFESDKFSGSSVTMEDMLKLSRDSSLRRARAKIQNELNLFLADKQIRKYRGVLAEEEKEKAIEEKSMDLPIYQVYIDETGKTQDYVSVGALWITDGGSTINTFNAINKWKKDKAIDFEFHFKKLSDSRINLYRDFFELFLSHNPTVGFKAIIIKKKGLSNLQEAITHLTFHLINQGIVHENKSGRAPLPRRLEVFIDGEEESSDQIKIENLKERITSQKIDGLLLGNFESLDSGVSLNIQIVDLFIASINRKLHYPNSEGKAKDLLADHILSLVGLDISKIDKNNKDIDGALVFDLRL